MQAEKIVYDLSVPVLREVQKLTRRAPGRPPRRFRPEHIGLPDGYHIEPLVINLSIPTTMIFDGQDMLVAESGFVKTAPPRVLRIGPDWTVQVIADKGLNGPVTGILEHDGEVYISHRGKVSVVSGDGQVRDIVTGLPSFGDHQNNQIVMGPDGKIYLGQGTNTNSGVVGVDNYIFGWLTDHPEGHDVPCRDVTLAGQNFQTENPLTPGHEKVMTGAYQAYGNPVIPGQVVKGNVKCSGSILRFNPDGSDLEVYASGLRNPFGLAFDENGQLWCTHHGADVRGSRPIANDPDYFIKVEQGAWYGWPDFFAGKPVTDPEFHEPGQPRPEFLWQEHPPLANAFTYFKKNAGCNGFAFSTSGDFGYAGEAFVALFGAFIPVTTGLGFNAHGFRVVRVDRSGQVHDFARNRLPGPSYLNRDGGFDRPSDITFGPDGSMYIVDWGGSTIGPQGLKLMPLTGAIWRVYKDGMSARRPRGPLEIEPPPQIPREERKPEVRNAPELYRMYAPQLLTVLGGLGLILVAIVLIGRAVKRSLSDDY